MMGEELNDRQSDPLVPEGFDLALVLGGGNALEAYHLGACEELLASGPMPS